MWIPIKKSKNILAPDFENKIHKVSRVNFMQTFTASLKEHSKYVTRLGEGREADSWMWVVGQNACNEKKVRKKNCRLEPNIFS